MAIAEIHVVLKPTLLDAQGATVHKALHQLGHTQVRNVRIGKYITVEVDDTLSDAALQEQLDQMCRHLLSNPVIEDYEITLDTAASAAPATARVQEPLTAVTTPLVSATTTAPTVTTPAGLVAASNAPVSALAPSEQVTVGKVSPSAVGTPDPFAMDYDAYDAMPANEQLALQQIAWQKHGGWIRQQLTERRAAWILCIGGEVVEAGASLDSLPSEAQRDQLGTTRNLVPWVFTQPTA